MEVRLKFGRYEGEIKDVVADVARELVASGRAEDPRFDELKTFPTGGFVTELPAVLVGETVSDHVIPAATAQKLQQAVRATAKGKR